ncbi:MAG: penicillin-binding protein activator [Pseudomonadota bacterium]
MPLNLSSPFAVRLSVLIVLGLLGACVPESATLRPSTNPQEMAERHEADGRFDRAARTYERLADSATTGSRRDDYLLRASRAWFSHGESIRALGTLRKVRGAYPNDDPIIGILLATDKLVNGEARGALSDLERLRPQVQHPQQPAYLELLARAQAATGDAVGAIQTLTERESRLRRSDDIRQNRTLLWSTLRDLGRKGHPLETPEDADRNLQGWLALARVYRDHRRNRASLALQVREWENEYREHRAAVLTDNLADDEALPSGEQPKSVALLLPMSGRFSGPAMAIRDGFIAAYLSDNDNAQRPQVQLFDTASVPVVEAYETAIRNGAEFVVGPLSKRNVGALIENNAVATTTLALNYLDEGQSVPINFFQFSLAPEHESAAIARHALAEGIMRSVALVPDSALGERLLNSFALAYEAGGGQLLDAGRYTPTDKDFAAPITNLLNLNSSRARHQELSAIVGERLEFEPRRREDAQSIFLVASARQGRLLRPQLNYHYANDLPVISTASIFEDDPNLNRKDLEGVTFADTPWIVSTDDTIVDQREALTRAWPERVKRFGRLYAMGMDAYALLSELHGQQVALNAGFPGLTGRLSLAPGNRITRDLDIAVIRRGRAEYVPPLDEQDSLTESIDLAP